jgi:putative effector of murein hydrolase
VREHDYSGDRAGKETGCARDIVSGAAWRARAMSAALTLYGIFLTFAAHALSRLLGKRFPSPFTTPVCFSTTLIVLVLFASGLQFEDYRPAKDVLVVLLGPATVALAVPIFKTRHILAAYAVPALTGIVTGVLSTVLVALALGSVFEFDRMVMLSMSVKSVTAPIAIELAGIMQGNLTRSGYCTGNV